LRLHITLAKIRHVNPDDSDAFPCWLGAMKAIEKFRLTNGRTTKIIVMSIVDTLRRQGHHSLENHSLRQVATLDQMARPGGTRYWIAGLRHWSEYLESHPRSRM
ncbi:hypothetical protein GE09DRAFT_982156, partial [Coniochaeta sp. 2T2.1]